MIKTTTSRLSLRLKSTSLLPFHPVQWALSKDWVFPCIIIVSGAIVRLAHLFFVGVHLPFQFGGLFAEFSQQIAENNYMLPARIPFYTDGGIPYAYPPLPFYIEALLIDLIGLPKFLVVNLLPPFFSILTLPSFYSLTKQVGLNRGQQLFALLAFAILPSAFTQQVEGAGLAEAMGTLSLIWLLFSILAVVRTPTLSSFALLGFWWGICLLSSPGSALASLPLVLVFAASIFSSAKGKTRLRSIGLLILAGLFAIFLSIPYWIHVISNYGITLIVNSVLAQHEGVGIRGVLQELLGFQILEGPYSVLWNMLIFWGLVNVVINGPWHLFLWFAILFLIPREGEWMVSIPSALLASIGASTMIHFLLKLQHSDFKGESTKKVAATTWLIAIVVVHVIWYPIATVRNTLLERDNSMSDTAISSFEWIQKNLPENGKLVVLSGKHLKEWTPHLARRTVLNITYGTEWEPEEGAKIKRFEQEVQDCLDWNCVGVQVQDFFGYDNFYILYEDEFARDFSLLIKDNKFQFRLLWMKSGITVGQIERIGKED